MWLNSITKLMRPRSASFGAWNADCGTPRTNQTTGNDPASDGVDPDAVLSAAMPHAAGERAYRNGGMQATAQPDDRERTPAVVA